MEKTKFLVIITTVAILLSSLSAINFMHSAYAQDFGMDAKNKNTQITNSGVTGASSQRHSSLYSLRVTPNSGPAGTEFTIYGTGFTPGYDIAISSGLWDKPLRAFANKSGFFVLETEAPSSATPNTYVIKAISAGGLAFDESSFTVTKKISDTRTPTPKPPVQAPKPPTDTTTNTNSATGGGGSSSASLTLNPTSGPPGTEVEIKGLGFSGSTISVTMGGTKLEQSPENSFTMDFGGIVMGTLTIPADAQPGSITITVDSSQSHASATFTVTGKKVVTATSPTSTLKGTQGTSQSNNPNLPIDKKGTLGTGTVTSTSGANSGAPNSPQPAPNPISKMSGKTSGARFQVIKTVVGGDASPGDFNFIVKLTGPSGNAQYSLNLEWIDWPSAMYDFGLNLPKGNTLSEGNYQILETNPGEYTATYSKGCSGSYDNDGYMYTCSVTNTKKVIPNTVASVAKGPKVPLPQPIITPPVSSKTIKSTLPTVSNTGKLTLPTTSKSAGTISKPPTVQSCPAGSVVVNGNCVSKGKIVGVLQ